ncbi:MAG: hypothetical protein H6806_04305 [Planctomycetes bacterium]|nr:hypothetical protein [Planctomycetota bacterium]
MLREQAWLGLGGLVAGLGVLIGFKVRGAALALVAAAVLVLLARGALACVP